MAVICLKAFSFLQSRLRENGLECSNECMEIPEGRTVEQVISGLGLEDQVEAAFVNGRVASFATVLKDGDRLALVPPGTPGPYRVLLGIRDGKNRQEG